MSPLTLFLGKLIGVYCVIVALTLMAHKHTTVDAIRSLLGNPPLLLLVEVLGLMAGLATVIGHNIWSGGALAIVITLLGWLVTIRGAALLALSQDAKMKLFEALRYEERFYAYMGAILAFGIYLTIAAFGA
jgi:hypothetical protein